jgi:hypothetical protein
MPEFYCRKPQFGTADVQTIIIFAKAEPAPAVIFCPFNQGAFLLKFAKLNGFACKTQNIRYNISAFMQFCPSPDKQPKQPYLLSVQPSVFPAGLML